MIMECFLSQVMNSASQLVQDFDSLASGQLISVNNYYSLYSFFFISQVSVIKEIVFSKYVK